MQANSSDLSLMMTNKPASDRPSDDSRTTKPTAASAYSPTFIYDSQHSTARPQNVIFGHTHHQQDFTVTKYYTADSDSEYNNFKTDKNGV